MRFDQFRLLGPVFAIELCAAAGSINRPTRPTLREASITWTVTWR